MMPSRLVMIEIVSQADLAIKALKLNYLAFFQETQ